MKEGIHSSQDEYGAEVPRKETEDVTEERMYSETQMIQLTKFIGIVAYAEGFQRATEIPDSRPKKKSKLLKQVLTSKQFALDSIRQYFPSSIREQINLHFKR
jgi:hypothetical protein